MNFNKIITELCWRLENGTPDFKNPEHLQELKVVLIMHKWTTPAINELIETLTEEQLYVNNAENRRRGRVGKPWGSSPGDAPKKTKDEPEDGKAEKEPEKDSKKGTPQITKKEIIKQSKKASAKFMKGFSEPDILNSKQRAASIKKSTDYINEGKTPEERTERMLEEKKKRRAEITNLDNLPAGTPASSLGEQMGGLAMEDIAANPNETEDAWVERQMTQPPPDGIYGTPLYHKIIDESNQGSTSLEKWLRTSHKTGKSELDIVTNKSGKDGKYKGKNPQTPPYPNGNIFDYKGKALVQNELENKKKACSILKNPQQREDCSKHYQKQLDYVKDLDETDTGVLYEMENGETGFKHTSNKSSLRDQLNNTSVGKKVKALNESLNSLAHISSEEKKAISTAMDGTMNKAVTVVAQAESIVGRDLQKKSDEEIKEISENKNMMGILTNLPFSGLYGGPKPGREKEYFDKASSTGHAKAELESSFGPEPKDGYTDQQKLQAILQAAKKGGIELLVKSNGKPTPTGKAAKEAGISSPPSKEDEGEVFSTTTKGGKITHFKIVDGKARSVVKSTNADTGEEEYTPDVTGATGKVLLKLSSRINQVRKMKKSGMSTKDIAEKFEPSMTEEEANTLLSEEFDFLEETYENRKESMSKAHKIVVDEVKLQDKNWIERNPEKAKQMGIPPANGPATQAYVDTWLVDTHIKRMLLNDEVPTGMNMGGKSIEARHMRECLKKITGKPDATPEEMYDYLKKNVRIEAEGSSIVINEVEDKVEGKGVKQLGKEDYRTKGDSKGIMAIFGKDMVSCLEKV
jgi:hypothetical protein